ncbi:uncharacterized protein BDZ99DRAFT_470897 [Mytilinidion resinicola]|uniref:Uncharacterized protein n=1 Tax=Mytilinidion resinicola TaxID=574789 RepID=A0A6A6ZCC6_9PEZI|nr:uncharacterized protein BDZ99DRAFT_470897 [Mytilinidion resinicola]KAF2817965.1 hypothetical protein BDZ99DRAFT_470897 [Mytilinidion resinicola]
MPSSTSSSAPLAHYSSTTAIVTWEQHDPALFEVGRASYVALSGNIAFYEDKRSRPASPVLTDGSVGSDCGRCKRRRKWYNQSARNEQSHSVGPCHTAYFRVDPVEHGQLSYHPLCRLGRLFASQHAPVGVSYCSGTPPHLRWLMSATPRGTNNRSDQVSNVFVGAHFQLQPQPHEKEVQLLSFAQPPVRTYTRPAHLTRRKKFPHEPDSHPQLRTKPRYLLCSTSSAVRALDKTPVMLPVTTKDAISAQIYSDLKPPPFESGRHVPIIAKDGIGATIRDTPAPSAGARRKWRARTMAEKEAKLVDRCATFYRNSEHILMDNHLVDVANTAINRPDMRGFARSFNNEVCIRAMEFEDGVSRSTRIRMCRLSLGPDDCDDSISDLLENLVEIGATRCIHALDAEEGRSMPTLTHIARGKDRKVEKMRRTGIVWCPTAPGR